jgi:hypothetical protein
MIPFAFKTYFTDLYAIKIGSEFADLLFGYDCCFSVVVHV